MIFIIINYSINLAKKSLTWRVLFQAKVEHLVVHKKL